MNTTLKIFLPVLLLAAVGCSATGPAGTAPGSSDRGPVVATVGGRAITLAEFERQYLRTTADSATAARDSVGAYRDFLDRYVDFRLKVLEAEAAGYGDRADLAAELRQYRTQLARPYLIEREVVEPLVRQLYERRKEMVDASHILLRLMPEAAPGDTLRAWTRLRAIADSILAGADFTELATRHSEDPSAQAPAGQVGSGGRLGFFSAGRMVPEFEDAMYSTPVGELSGIVRTQFGYHVLKVNARRPTVPDLRISHIMAQSASPSPADTLAAWERMVAAQNRLADGTPFEAVARDLSDDPQSAGRGGDLDFVAYDGWLPVEMRDAVFAVDSVGAVVGPIRTRFGWHLMKITGRREMPSFDEAYPELQAEIARTPRSQAAEKAYARRLMRTRGYSVDSTLVGQLFGTRGVDSLMSDLAGGTVPTDLAARRFVTLGDSSYTLGRFAGFVAERSGAFGSDAPAFQRAVDAFLEDRALAYEVDALESRDADFAQTMREFREGLMLFRLMEDSVWTAATLDTTGLRSWYETHADEYRFGERIRVVGFYAPHDSLLQSVVADLGAGRALPELVAAIGSDDGSSVRVDTTRLEGPSDSVFDRALSLEPGGHTGVLSFGGGRVVLVHDGTEPPRAKTFAEARAEVANAWQARLEERLLDRLRAKYGVRVEPDVLARAFEELRAATR